MSLMGRHVTLRAWHGAIPGCWSLIKGRIARTAPAWRAFGWSHEHTTDD